MWGSSTEMPVIGRGRASWDITLRGTQCSQRHARAQDHSSFLKTIPAVNTKLKKKKKIICPCPPGTCDRSTIVPVLKGEGLKFHHSCDWYLQWLQKERSWDLHLFKCLCLASFCLSFLQSYNRKYFFSKKTLHFFLVEPIHELSAWGASRRSIRGNNESYYSDKSHTALCLILQACKTLLLWQPGKPFCLTFM